MRFIKHLGVGHHPFSKKYEFKGYFNEPTPSLIATDYKAPKTVLELWTDDYKAKESDNLTDSIKYYNADEQTDFISEEEEWSTELAIREKEGSPVPREIERKTYEQHSFTYASLFSGIGGFEQALNQFGGECVFASEIDKFAAQAYETLYGHKPAGDITKIDAKDVPDHDLLVGGFPCFAEGTLITTSEGVKPIEDVRKGDKVLTHTNKFQDVVVPMMKRKKGIYELRVQGSPSTLITEEHPVYVREMSRRWNNELRRYERVWGEPKWVNAENLEQGVHFVGMSENNNTSNPHRITAEEAWLIGRYVADGYIRNGKRNGRKNSYNNQVIYCVGKSKLSEFKRNLGEYYAGISEDRTSYKCRITNKRLMDLCLEAGRGSENKRIPGYILDLPENLLESFLDGYMSGDGCVIKGIYQATSVSRQLVYGLAQVVQKLYKTPYSIQFTARPKKTVIEGRTVNQRDTWMLRFRKENRKQQDGVYIDGMLWMPIRSITYDAEFEGNVYNFEVAVDNSYVANNLTVHNCQAFSVAGKRKGLEDARGTLFFEIARIASEKQPKALLLENVKGLVNHDKGRTLDLMIETLNEIGYVIDFDVLNSKYFGVPQNRERIFIVAVRADLIESEEFSEEATKGQTIVPKGKRRIGEWADVFNFDFPQQTEVTTRLRDILESNVDEKYYLDEERTASLMTQLEEKDKTVDTVGHHPFSKKYEFKGYNSEISPSLIATDYKAPKTVLKSEVRPVLTPDRINKRQNGRRFKEDGEEMFTLTSQDRHGIAIREATKRGYAVACEGDAVNFQFPDSKTRRGRVGKQIANTLEASSINQGVVGAPPRYRIRKLTPRECWRLQNFSDDAFDKVKTAGLSDSQMYKQAGNAVTVSVVKAIGERLLPILESDSVE